MCLRRKGGLAKMSMSDQLGVFHNDSIHLHVQFVVDIQILAGTVGHVEIEAASIRLTYK